MHGYNRAVISCERNAKYLQKTLKTNESYLPLKRPSAGPFFKSILAEIYFTIYKSRPVYLDEPFGVTVFGCFPCEEPEQRSVRDSCQGLLARMQRACRNGRRGALRVWGFRGLFKPMEGLRTLIGALPCYNSILLHNFWLVKLFLPRNSPKCNYISCRIHYYNFLNKSSAVTCRLTLRAYILLLKPKGVI